MEKKSLIVSAALMLGAIFATNFAFAKTETKTETSTETNAEMPIADDILGDESAFDVGSVPTVSSNNALDHLESIKFDDTELVTFMKSGGLKSRIFK